MATSPQRRGPAGRGARGAPRAQAAAGHVGRAAAAALKPVARRRGGARRLRERPVVGEG